MHVVTFYSTSVAIRAEKVTKGAGFVVKLIPTPRHLSADCGTALRIEDCNKDAIMKLLNDNHVQFGQIAPLTPA